MNSRSTGEQATAIIVKSHSSQNIKITMKTIVSTSMAMLSVEEDANSWIVATSVVMVETSAPTLA